MHKRERSQQVKAWAEELGFVSTGIAASRRLDEEAPRLERWLSGGMHGSMNYMENHFEKRLDPGLLVDGARSVISLLYNYYPSEKQRSDSYHISKYAYGQDYHFVIKRILKDLTDRMEESFGTMNFRVFVDSAPVLERAWASLSGLGWIGKHSLLINQSNGSYFFLAEIICDLEFEYDGPVTDHCGTCTKCLDACPTEAIVDPYVVDGSKCISYFTIELKDAIPSAFSDQFEDWMFGCDICQDVCPWNRFSKPHQQPAFEPDDRLLTYSKQEWKELSEETFAEIFRKSAVKRTKYAGLKRNIEFVDRTIQES